MSCTAQTGRLIFGDRAAAVPDALDDVADLNTLSSALLPGVTCGHQHPGCARRQIELLAHFRGQRLRRHADRLLLGSFGGTGDMYSALRSDRY